MANHRVVVDLETLPKGEPIEVLYLGVFENGATHDLTDEQVASYEAVTRRKFPSSGYLFAGAPRTDAQKAAYEQNEKEKFEQIGSTEQQATEVSAHSSTVVDEVEGSEQ